MVGYAVYSTMNKGGGGGWEGGEGRVLESRGNYTNEFVTIKSVE